MILYPKKNKKYILENFDKVLGKLLMWCGVYCSNLFQGVWYMAKIAPLKEVGWRKGLESSVSSYEAGKLYYDIKKDM